MIPDRTRFSVRAARLATALMLACGAALANCEDPDTFLRERVDGQYPARDVVRAA